MMHRRSNNEGPNVEAPHNGGSGARLHRSDTDDKLHGKRVSRKRSPLPTSVLLMVILGAIVMVSCIVWVGYNIINSSITRKTKIVLNPADFAGDGKPKYDPDQIMPWNRLYQAEDAHPVVGDRSDRYAKLRQQIDPLLPPDAERSLQRVAELQSGAYQGIPMTSHHSDQVPYDIYSCPDQPPAGYPFEWNMLDILTNWKPDDPAPKPNVHQGLCVFDFQKDYDKAMNYRHAELPFIVVNDPEVARSVERWVSSYRTVFGKADEVVNSRFSQTPLEL
jgi:hypothetical protein